MTVIELVPRQSERNPAPVFTVQLFGQERGEQNSSLVKVIRGASGYQLEGPLTTFFRNESGKPTMDAWSVRVASVRTNDVVSIEQHRESTLG